MIGYNVETLAQCLEEMKPLLEEHYSEIAMYKDKIELNPDYDTYFALEENGHLHIVTVRDEGKLIGYYVSYIHKNMHYQDHLFAVNDVLFLHPDYRGGTVAYRMIRYAEEQLKALGVSVIMLHMKVAYPFEELCQALGMDKAEYVYTKFLGD